MKSVVIVILSLLSTIDVSDYVQVEVFIKTLNCFLMSVHLIYTKSNTNGILLFQEYIFEDFYLICITFFLVVPILEAHHKFLCVCLCVSQMKACIYKPTLTTRMSIMAISKNYLLKHWKFSPSL